MTDSMHGKVVIVTGANTGIGKATALGLARRGATTVLACRDLQKGHAAMAEIRAQTDAAELHLLRLDLASLESVRAFARDFAARFSRLDVLIENAGVSTAQRQVSADGYELDFAVNHLGHFLLTRLLLPQLKAAAPSRVVVVSSSVHKGAALDFDDLQGKRRWSMMGSYSRSKLANMLFTRALAKRLEESGVTVNALHPGVVASELARDFPSPFRWLARLLFKSPETGARTSLFVATAPELASVSGGYFANARAAKPGRAALDDVAAERLWEVSEKLVESGATA
jgi:NAD(P)-dependent dehydrogenase (short-subunit alcohol dehydrogenase family)